MFDPRSRRRRSRGPRGRTLGTVLLAVVVVAFAVGPALPGAAVTVGSVSRTGAVNPVQDSDAVHRLNLTSALQEGADNCLVAVTNHLGTPVTVTVALDGGSTDLGTLHADGTSGDAVDVYLREGASVTVGMDVAAGTNGSTVSFAVNAAGTGLTVDSVDRNAPVERNASTTCA